jgi:hypothetical protein
VTFYQLRHPHTPPSSLPYRRSDLVRHVPRWTESVHRWSAARYTRTTYPWLCQSALDIIHDGKYRKTTASRSLKHAAPKPSISPDSRHYLKDVSILCRCCQLKSELLSIAERLTKASPDEPLSSLLQCPRRVGSSNALTRACKKRSRRHSTAPKRARWSLYV